MRDQGALAAFLQRTKHQSADISARADVIAEKRAARRAGANGGANGAASREAAAALAELQAHNEELLLCIEELRTQREALVEAHRHLEREHARYIDLFEGAPDAYVTTD